LEVQQSNNVTANWPFANSMNFPNKSCAEYCDVLVTCHERVIRLWVITLSGIQLVNSIDIVQPDAFPLYCSYLHDIQMLVVLLGGPKQVLQVVKLDAKENKVVIQVEQNIVNLKYSNNR
jgi:hypothetical protein